jgi:RNA polymerase sigma-70 factor, ECF subfamily
VSLSPGEDNRPLELVERAAAGDADALEKLLLRERPGLVGYIKRLMPKDIQRVVGPDDLLQEVYCEAFGRIGDLRGKPAELFERWLLTMARHRVIDEVRRQRAQKRGGRHRRLPTAGPDWQRSMENLLDELAVDHHTPSRIAARHEAYRELDGAVEALPPHYRRAVELRYFEGMNVADIAQRMGRSQRAVHNLCTRALQQLRVAMGSRSRLFSSS